MELMRESINTTMRYYVGQNAQRTARTQHGRLTAAQARQQGGAKAATVNSFVNISEESSVLCEESRY